MTFKHKISRRLALLRGALTIGAVLSGCSDRQEPFGPRSGVEAVDPNTATVLPVSTTLGDRVRASSVAYIRAEARVSAALVGTQPVGALGTIVEGPITDAAGDGLVRYRIDFDSGVDGWGSAPYLDRIGTSPVASIALTPSPLNLGTGATATVQPTLRDAAGHLLNGRSIAFTSADTAIATVSTAGAVTGRQQGTTTLRVAAEGVTAIDTVRVGIASFSVGARIRTNMSASVRASASVNATLTGIQPAGVAGTILEGPVDDTAGDGLRRWRVDFDSGVDGWAAEPFLTLEGTAPATPTLSSLSVSPTAVTATAGTTTQFTAAARDANGNAMSGITTTWTSKDTTKVRISTNGLATALAAGTTWIVAASAQVRDSTAMIVNVASTPAPPAVRVGYYVSPNGASANDGSVSRPWDLATALSGAAGRVRAGDTVWVRAGSYRGSYRSTVSGSSGRPIVFRAYPGERASIEHSGSALTTLSVQGGWTVFWGLEVTNLNTTRSTTSTASEQRPNGIVNGGSNNKYINVVVHDAGVGFYNYAQAANVELTGSIFYNNGWQAPDRGHGHGMYVKSDVGPVLVKDNVLFNQFGYGVHVYSNAGDGNLINIRVEGNTSFNNGTLANNSNSENILYGGDAMSSGAALVGNLTYFTPGRGGRNVRVGFESLLNGSLVVTNNRFVGGSPVLDVGFWTTAQVSGNTLVGGSQMVRQNNPSLAGLLWSGNTVRRDPNSSAWYALGAWRSFSAWKLATGLGLTDQATATAPSGTEVYVKASAYEAGRALVTVYDWTRSGTATASLSGVLNVGDRYEVRSVQNLFGAPIASGTYTGSISLPMGRASAPVPVGLSSSASPATGTEFDVFLVVRVP